MKQRPRRLIFRPEGKHRVILFGMTRLLKPLGYFIAILVWRTSRQANLTYLEGYGASDFLAHASQSKSGPTHSSTEYALRLEVYRPNRFWFFT